MILDELTPGEREEVLKACDESEATWRRYASLGYMDYRTHNCQLCKTAADLQKDFDTYSICICCPLYYEQGKRTCNEGGTPFMRAIDANEEITGGFRQKATDVADAIRNSKNRIPAWKVIPNVHTDD